MVKVAVGIRVGIGVLDQASHNLPYRRRQMVYDYLKPKAVDMDSSSFP